MADFSALDRLDRLGQELGERRTELDRVASEIAEIEIEALAAEGRVRVTIGAGGQVKAISIDPQAMRLGSECLAEELVAACQQAAQDYAGRVRELTGQVLGTPLGGGSGRPQSAVSEPTYRGQGAAEGRSMGYSRDF